MFITERKYLKLAPSIEKPPEATRASVRKANVVHFKQNRYEVPKGTYFPGRDLISANDFRDTLEYLARLIPPTPKKSVHIKVVREGHKVFFAEMDALMHILKTAEISTKSAARIKWIRKCDLVVIDEVGYLPVSNVEANLFFGLISSLYEKASVIITSNKGFTGWADMLGDSVLATALLDRLTHRCQLLDFEDESWRLAHREQIF